jgi:hypothetical protein
VHGTSFRSKSAASPTNRTESTGRRLDPPPHHTHQLSPAARLLHSPRLKPKFPLPSLVSKLQRQHNGEPRNLIKKRRGIRLPLSAPSSKKKSPSNTSSKPGLPSRRRLRPSLGRILRQSLPSPVRCRRRPSPPWLQRCSHRQKRRGDPPCAWISFLLLLVSIPSSNVWIRLL